MEDEYDDEIQIIEEEKEGCEIFDEFIDEYKLYRNEGTEGIKQLNKICEGIGYKEDNLLYGTSLERFLQDNSGCIEVIKDFIRDNVGKGNEWKEELETWLTEEDEDE